MNDLLTGVQPLFTSAPFLLFLVFGSYLLGVFIYTRSRIALLHPIIISIGVIIGTLHLLEIDYDTFARGSYLVDFMLGPSVVALGYTLYTQLDYIKGRALSILISVAIGSFIGIASVILICNLMGVDQAIMASLEPKSVTTPIALSLSERSGGIAPLTAIVVVICGIFGGMVGPFVLKHLNIKSPIAKGLALGSAAHGLGTARAIELGAVEGAISGLAIGLMGVMTSLLLPLIELLFRQ